MRINFYKYNLIRNLNKIIFLKRLMMNISYSIALIKAKWYITE